MHPRTLLIATCLLSIVAACNKQNAATQNLQKGSESSSTAKSEFQSKRFLSTWTDSYVLLTSPTECELKSKVGIFLGTYSSDEKRIRFVVSAFGSQQVAYAELYSDGIVFADGSAFKKGEVFLTEEALMAKQEEERRAKRSASLKRTPRGERPG